MYVLGSYFHMQGSDLGFIGPESLYKLELSFSEKECKILNAKLGKKFFKMEKKITNHWSLGYCFLSSKTS